MNARLLPLSSLDHHFAEFIQRIDAAPCRELWLAAALVSAAAGRGHVCLDLGDTSGVTVIPFEGAATYTIPDPERWREALAPCSTVGRPGDYTPLVLDGADRLYLHRSWDYERRVATCIQERLSLQRERGDADRLAGLLARYFPATGENPDRQRIAAEAALTRSFTVITGGPGTGKTSTVVRILAMLLEQAAGRMPEIALAAPTGKAAMRLSQSLRLSAENLPLPEALRPFLPLKARTIHRLLGVIPGKAVFRHNRENRLPCDLLVVDEASMVDLPLMAKLMESLRDDASLILLGDRDQLASVEAGAVLGDICNRGDVRDVRSPLADAIVPLTRSWRFGSDSGIGQLARLVNQGDGDGALELLESGRFPDIAWRPLPQADAFEAEFQTAAQNGYGDYAAATGAEEALAALDRFRIISPLREGRYGVAALNRLTERALECGPSGPGERWYRRQAVMMSGNDYGLGLYNGDTGVLFPDDDRLYAWFRGEDGELRRILPMRLTACDPAFALTVHKCQGSEFERLLLILPDRDSDLITRELIYTAITRARRGVEIWGDSDLFRAAVQRRIVRSSGLRERLWGMVGPHDGG